MNTRQTTEAKLISQKENYANSFGEVLRSSGIFYFKQSTYFKTTISFLNYWFVRQNISITVIANVRLLSGKLLKRERLDFLKGNVINYSPFVNEEFEGTVEIEIFSLNNLRIPYAALMAVYESELSISMVHGYARIYSQHEIEEGRTITNGNEACIPLTKDGLTEVIFHNGTEIQQNQKVKIRINFDNHKEIEKTLELKELNKFETTKINVSQLIIRNTKDWKVAECYISFELKNAFTRVLCVNRNSQYTDFQVTHSDFNYSIHKTDKIRNNWAAVSIPKNIPGIPSLLTWGANEKDKLIIKNEDSEHAYDGEKLLLLKAKPGDLFEYKSLGNDEIPSRIHNAIVVNIDSNVLPAICNLGVYHDQRPPKKMWWAIIGYGNEYSTGISVCALRNIYGDTNSVTANIRLYSEISKEFLSTDIPIDSLLTSKIISIESLFSNYKSFLGDNFGYITLYSEYGGLILFTYIIHKSGSLTIEHGF